LAHLPAYISDPTPYWNYCEHFHGHGNFIIIFKDRKIPKMKHLPPNYLNENANGTIWKLVSRASQWVPMLRGFDKLLEFSSFLFSRYVDLHPV
jgi:hypothetical protein